MNPVGGSGLSPQTRMMCGFTLILVPGIVYGGLTGLGRFLCDRTSAWLALPAVCGCHTRHCNHLSCRHWVTSRLTMAVNFATHSEARFCREEILSSDRRR